MEVRVQGVAASSGRRGVHNRTGETRFRVQGSGFRGHAAAAADAAPMAAQAGQGLGFKLLSSGFRWVQTFELGV